jgi:NADH-quinone oxidoreductase subunit H
MKASQIVALVVVMGLLGAALVYILLTHATPQVITSVVVAVIVMHILLIMGPAYGILLERKVAAWAQDRIGPNRVGPFGLLQPIADGVKFLFKEDFNPGNVDRGLFLLAPVLAVIPALIGWAVIPWGGVWECSGQIPAMVPIIGGTVITQPFTVDFTVADINIGVIYILAIGSLAVYGITIGAWASNNKYTFFGGIRATSQMLSYEIPMGLCVLCVLMLAGTAHAGYLAAAQVDYWWGVIPSWYIFQQPLVAIIFFTCILAESNRAPFDLAEAEQELIGGFHTEYSSMKFAMFFLGEYIHMAIGAAFFSVLFLGGWHLPWLDYAVYGGPQPVEAGILGVLLKLGVLTGKVLFLLFVMMWIRWTLPRLRFDQLMRLAWRAMIPISLALLLMTGVFVYLGWQDLVIVGNLLIMAGVLLISPHMPRDENVNRRVPLAGSRFNPLPAE